MDRLVGPRWMAVKCRTVRRSGRRKDPRPPMGASEEPHLGHTATKVGRGSLSALTSRTGATSRRTVRSNADCRTPIRKDALTRTRLDTYSRKTRSDDRRRRTSTVRSRNSRGVHNLGTNWVPQARIRGTNWTRRRHASEARARERICVSDSRDSELSSADVGETAHGCKGKEIAA